MNDIRNAESSILNITIEHIMPQALTQEWREELGESASEIHDRWYDRQFDSIGASLAEAVRELCVDPKMEPTNPEGVNCRR